MKRLRRYRLLLIVFVLAGLRALWEVAVPPRHDDEQSASTVVRELYPESADAYYQRGLAALSKQRDYKQARRYFERALATGIKTDEDLLYDYASVLVHLDEDPKLVTAAIVNWRRNFPNSNRVDPRIVVRITPPQFQPKSNRTNEND